MYTSHHCQLSLVPLHCKPILSTMLSPRRPFHNTHCSHRPIYNPLLSLTQNPSVSIPIVLVPIALLSHLPEIQGTDWVSVTRVNFENSTISKEVDGGGPYGGGGTLRYQLLERQSAASVCVSLRSALGVRVIRFRKLKPGISHPARTERRKIRIL